LSPIGRAPAAGALGVAALVVLLAFGSGGYFPSDWGIALLACALLASGAALVRDRLDAGVADAAFTGGLLAFAGWTALSAWWADSAGPPVYDAERALLYAAAAAAIALAVPRGAAVVVPLAVFAAAIFLSVYGLVAQLFPGAVGRPYDPFGHYQVDQPIGYSNAGGLVALFALLLALGFALHGERLLRIAAAGAIVPATAALLLSFSRGALVALAVSLPVLLALDRDARRSGRLGLLSLPALAGPVIALRTPDVYERGLDVEAAARAGHRLAAILLVLTIAAAALAALDARWAPRRRPLLAAAGLAAAAAVAVVAVIGPGDVERRALDAFRANPPAVSSEAGRRLLTASGNRPEYWRVALRVARDHPVAGAGGGMYERHWLRDRTVDESVRNAHSLYFETLAELGGVGLALLLTALAVPLLVLRRGRGSPLTPTLAAAYVAYLVHAGLDWDWELPAVTLLAVGCGAGLLAEHRRDASFPLGPRRRAVLVGALAPVLAVALVAHVGNRAAAASSAALLRDDSAAAEREARRAIHWQPWSIEGRLLLGQAQLAAGDERAARPSLLRAVRGDPGDWLAWYTLAAASHGPEARRALARAARLNPRAVEIRELEHELSS
jgi:O-antigen ligase